jgi:hypothetical protein
MNLTGTDIVNLLKTNDKAIARALVVLKNNQTADEQSDETTKHQNGKGFRPAHAKVGTSMAKFYEKNGYLTEKQIGYWRKEGKQGMRISIYWKQLLSAAREKAKAASAA